MRQLNNRIRISKQLLRKIKNKQRGIYISLQPIRTSVSAHALFRNRATTGCHQRPTGDERISPIPTTRPQCTALGLLVGQWGWLSGIGPKSLYLATPLVFKPPMERFPTSYHRK